MRMTIITNCCNIGILIAIDGAQNVKGPFGKKLATLAAAFLTCSVAGASAATISLGTYNFDSNLFGDTLVESDGGAFSAGNWLNIVNADPGNPAYLTGANFNTGIANIGLFGNQPSYTIGYTTAILNGVGNDLGVVTARFSISDTITLTINGNTLSFGPGLAANTGVNESYFYNNGGPFGSTLYVTEIDLSAFNVAPGGSISSITVTGGPELDLIRVAGYVAGDTPVPESDRKSVV